MGQIDQWGGQGAPIVLSVKKARPQKKKGEEFSTVSFSKHSLKKEREKGNIVVS